MTDTQTAPRHPARWSKPVLDVVGRVLAELAEDVYPVRRLLDPFAGVGLGVLQVVGNARWDVIGLELEHEWAAVNPRSCRTWPLVGRAERMPLASNSVQAVCSSPVFGNRMSDHHEARDACKAPGCGEGIGNEPGYVIVSTAASDAPVAALEAGTTVVMEKCKVCGGTGLSRRNTYRHALGRPLTDGNAGELQWWPPTQGMRYRRLHEAVMDECLRVLVGGGWIVWNIGNHYRTLTKGGPRVEQLVAEWHLNAWLYRGCRVHAVHRVPSAGNRYGANGHRKQDDPDDTEPRTDGELVMVLQAPAKTGLFA